jgi:hypothetical protein
MEIQYASDLHIDNWAVGTPFNLFITPKSPFLVIAGDICSAWNPLYMSFLRWASQNWYLIVLVAGNHEYDSTDGKTIEETNQHIQSIAAMFRNVVFLQDGASYVIPGTRVRFVGATLWSNIDRAIWDEGYEKKHDCSHIFTAKGRLHPSNIVNYHNKHVAALRYACRPTFLPETLIVVTHHIPTKQLLEAEYKGEKWSSWYASDCDDMLTSNIALWICGHGHRAAKYKPVIGPHVVMNARGYNKEKEMGRTVDVYNPTATYSVRVARLI